MDIIEYTIRREAITYKGEFVSSNWMEYIRPEALDVVLEYMLDGGLSTFSEVRDEICGILEQVFQDEKED